MKRSKNWTEKKYQRFINEGRGQGELDKYKPWITIQDIPSRGRATRLYSYKTNRIHHFFSDLQTRCFYLLEWADDVVDIREHFPLLDCRDVLYNTNFDLSKFKSVTGVDFVFTTTFLITKKKGKELSYHARAVKYANDLNKKTVIKRLMIEKAYWEHKEIDWAIVTNIEVPVVKAKNIEWLLSSKELNKNELISICDRALISKEIFNYIKVYSCIQITVLDAIDKKFNLANGTALVTLKYLICEKILLIDMDRKINLTKPVKIKIASKYCNEELINEVYDKFADI